MHASPSRSIHRRGERGDGGGGHGDSSALSAERPRSRAPAEENGVPVSGSTPIGKYSVGLESFWVKVISLLVCFGLYGCTLLAPYLLREYRDFGIEFDF